MAEPEKTLALIAETQRHMAEAQLSMARAIRELAAGTAGSPGLKSMGEGDDFIHKGELRLNTAGHLIIQEGGLAPDDPKNQVLATLDPEKQVWMLLTREGANAQTYPKLISLLTRFVKNNATAFIPAEAKCRKDI